MVNEMKKETFVLWKQKLKLNHKDNKAPHKKELRKRKMSRKSKNQKVCDTESHNLGMFESRRTTESTFDELNVFRGALGTDSSDFLILFPCFASVIWRLERLYNLCEFFCSLLLVLLCKPHARQKGADSMKHASNQ